MKRNDWLMVFGVALVVGGVLSLFASSSPDGLTWVATAQEFLHPGRNFSASLFSGYAVPVAGEGKGATALAGILGASIVFMFLFLIGKFLYCSKERDSVSKEADPR